MGTVGQVEPPRPLHPAWWTVGRHLLLSCLVLAAYANSLGAGLVFDNRAIILEDTRLRALTAEQVTLIFSKTYWWPQVSTALYRPVATLSYLFNYTVLGNGASPAGYHVVNLLIHLTNTLLAFAIGSRLTRTWIAFAVAAVWAVHPLLTEAVTNIVGRADLLSSFGVLAALWCHVRANDAPVRTRPWWRIGAATAAIIGVFSKESAVAVVAVIPLWDLVVARRSPGARAVWTSWLVAVAPATVLFVIARSAVLAGVTVAPVPFVDNPIVGVDWWTGRMTAVAIVANYLTLVSWPFALSCDYSFPQLTAVDGAPGDWLRIALVAGAAAVSIFAARRSRALGFVIASACVVFLPASNLLFATGTIMAERLAYLPSLGPIALAVAAAVALASRARIPHAAMAIVLACVIGILLAGTIARNRDWRDEVTLWTAAVGSSDRSFKTHGALAEALYNADPTRANLDAVIAHKERSLALLAGLPDPLLVIDPYGQAATYYIERGDWLTAHAPERREEARAAYAAAAKWARTYASAVDSALPNGQRATPRQRSSAQLLLSTAVLKAEDGGDAVAAAHRARASDPFRPAAYQAEAAALVSAGREPDAAVTLLAGFMVTGDASLRAAAMQMYRAGVDPLGCAIVDGPSGPVLNQRCETVRRHICAASAEAVGVFTAAGRTELAERARTAAVQQFGCR